MHSIGRWMYYSVVAIKLLFRANILQLVSSRYLPKFLRYRKVKLTTNFHCGSLQVVYRNENFPIYGTYMYIIHVQWTITYVSSS